MFVIKKIIASLMMPLPIAIGLLIIGTALLFTQLNKRYAIGCNVAGILLLLAFSTPWLPNYTISLFEDQYISIPPSEIKQDIAGIVVLGCGHKNDQPMPITSQLYHCSLARTTEGVRYAKHFYNAKLIFTGYAASNTVSNAEMNAKLAKDLGIHPDRIFVFTQPKDTQEEAKIMADFFRDEAFILVTEASHMPRAYQYFIEQGLNPIAAPTRHLQRDRSNDPIYTIAPHSGNIQKAERSWYEAMGLIAQQF